MDGLRTVTIYIISMDVLNGTESAVYMFCRFSISEGSDFPDYLEVTTIVVELCGATGRISRSRIPLKSMLHSLYS